MVASKSEKRILDFYCSCLYPVKQVTSRTLLSFPRCPVRGCQYRFGESGLSHHLLCHMDTTAKDEFRCPHCRQTFSSWRRCAMHLWTEHKINVDLLECPECKSYRTVVTAKMQRHLKLHHNPEKIFSCATCGRGFTSLSLLRDHCLAHFETGADAVRSLLLAIRRKPLKRTFVLL